jgi:hypothetical protein
MRWKHHPNLRLRPHAPAAGRGRLQTQIRRAFLIHGPVVSASTVYDWCYPRQRSSISCGQRWSVRRICRQLCDPICWPASRDPVAAAQRYLLRPSRRGRSSSSRASSGGSKYRRCTSTNDPMQRAGADLCCPRIASPFKLSFTVRRGTTRVRHRIMAEFSLARSSTFLASVRLSSKQQPV